MYGLAVSELGQLGRWCQDALDMGAEIDEHSDSVFHARDRAETVLVVGDLLINREALRGRRGIGNGKRTGRQMAPGHGAVRAHCYQYAPAWAAGRKEAPRDPGRGAASGAAAPLLAAGYGPAIRPACGGAAAPAQWQALPTYLPRGAWPGGTVIRPSGPGPPAGPWGPG